MTLEEQFQSWTEPSSPAEQEKQDRTERMIRDAVDEHSPFAECDLKVYPKGSYANNTNVRVDSDVDIAVECQECFYWEEQEIGAKAPGSSYNGPWSPNKLRTELTLALRTKFPGQVSSDNKVALAVHSSTARIDADVVPCFSYRYYFSSGGFREGTKIFCTDGSSIVNYPQQQLDKGRAKNARTNYAYKKTVRILKRVENLMVDAGVFREIDSYFIESLCFNCEDLIFTRDSWADVVRGVLFQIWNDVEGPEPFEERARWVEANGCIYLFHSGQVWTRADGREFAYAAWNYLGLGDG